jgi:transcriptional regulator
MYDLPYFKANNPTEVLAFMQAHPFITLCGVDTSNNPVATHIPVLFEERDGKMYLQAHIMRKQNHTIAFEHNPNVLAIFTGDSAYVSAGWYSTPNIGSTWNYRAVHAKGIIRFMDSDGLYKLLVKLTNYFEGNEDSPVAVKNLSKDYVRDNMKAIVGLEIAITDIQHVFKLSQNRDEESKRNIKEKIGNDMVH